MCVFRQPPQEPQEDPMKLIALYLADLNHLTRKEKARAWWYSMIIFAPLIAVLLTHWWYGPSLNRIVGW